MLAASVENECTYCVAAHSSGARMFKVEKDVVEKMAWSGRNRGLTPISDKN